MSPPVRHVLSLAIRRTDPAFVDAHLLESSIAVTADCSRCDWVCFLFVQGNIQPHSRIPTHFYNEMMFSYAPTER